MTYVVVNPENVFLWRLLGHHAYSHEESVKEDAGNGDCKLRELEQDSCLCDEVDALRSAVAFFGKGKAVDNRGGAGNLVLGE